MAEFWENDPVAQTAPRPPSNFWDADKVVGEPAAPQTPPPLSFFGGRLSTPIGAPTANLGAVMDAFGQGYREGFGPDRLGLSDENTKWLSDHKIFGPKEGGYDNPLQAAAELFANAAAGVGERAFRMMQGTFRGLAGASEQIGLPRDVSGIIGGEYVPSGGVPHAAPPTAAAMRLFGPQHPFGPIKGMPVVLHEVPAEARIAPVVAEGAPKSIEAYHGSPHDFDAFSMEHIGTGEGAQAYGHGLYFAENPDVAREYANKLAPQVPMSDAEMASAQAAMPDNPFAKAQLLTSRPDLSNLYRVRINADPEHFLDWDKPLSEQSEHVQSVLRPIAEQYKASSKILSDINVDELSGENLLRAVREQGIENIPAHKILFRSAAKNAADLPATASRILSDAGIPGIKYLDQGSRLAPEQIEHLRGQITGLEKLRVENPGDASVERALAGRQQELRDAEASETRNFVVFDDNSVEITHKNNVPVGPADIPDRNAISPALSEARELGVIGPPKPDVSKMSPAEAAATEVPRAQAAERTGDDVLRGPAPGAPEKAGNIRLDQIGINADAKDVILEAAKQNDDFNQVRAGNVRLRSPDEIAPNISIDKGKGELPLQGGGKIEFSVEGDKVKIRYSYLDESLRGKGIGLDGYQQLADWAIANGKTLESDSSVSRRAGRVYEALARRGYNVEKTALGEKPKPGPIDQLRPAFDAISERQNGISTVSISDLAKEAGIPIDDVKQLLIKESREDRVNLSGSSLAAANISESIKQGAIRIEGRSDDLLYATLTEKTPKYIYRVTGAPKSQFSNNVPPAQIESLSAASGISSKTLSENAGLGRLMHNDAVVRTWLQAFHQASDEIAAQLAKVKATGDEADIAALREMKIRFQHMQEQVSGLTAEAGRTLRVFRDFYESRGKAEGIGKLLEDNPGNDAESLKKLADAAGSLDPRTQLPKFLHDANKPTWWDKYLYYWVNALISGPVTHLKYIGANAAFGAYEAAVVTPVAGALGAVRRGLLGGSEGVYVGEAAARVYGLLAGTPDALKAAWTAARDNLMTPFPNEVAGKAVNPLTQVRPSAIGGKLGFAIGVPGRSAAGIHSFFRWLGYRAELEAQAYRNAAKEGLSPLNDDFWQRRAWHAENPTEAAINAGIENGNHLTFIGDQGTFGRAVSQLANTRMGPGGMQPFKLILPFTHIPGQILRAGLEQTPFAIADTKMRADLLGKNGAVAADTARARLIAGGVVSAMVANWAINDTVTGYGPTEQNDRLRWLRTHEPYSVRVGGWWVSYNKFGPIGDLVGLVANLMDIGPKVKEEDYASAAGHVIFSTAHILEDEVGMQGLVNLIEALDDKEGSKMSRFVASQTATNLPYSSLLRQTASFQDPILREAKTFVDQLRYSTPWSRQDLLPKRDWLGEPMTNPGYHSILRQRAVNPDPIDIEVSQMRGIRPAPPLARINNVALPPKIYDEYQAYAGALTRVGLESIIKQPGWQGVPQFIREQTFHSMIEQMRKTADGIMVTKHPEIFQQAVDDKKAKITGEKPTKLKD